MSEDKKKYGQGATLGSMAGFKDVDPELEGMRKAFDLVARMQKIKYDTLVEAGFSKSEALYLCKESMNPLSKG